MVHEKTIEQNKLRICLDVEEKIIYSEFLEREVKLDVYCPLTKGGKKARSLLLINDGQDLRTMDFARILDQLYAAKVIKPIICVGIHCGSDRLNEYGTAFRADYLGRGARAGLYTKFVVDELLPVIENELGITCKEKSFAGFSLGGLSALDIVLNHPGEFTKVGIFSGSLWWRRKGYDDEGYDIEKDRLMHLQVKKGRHHRLLKFFFQCGQLDETADRNNNGIIDSIEDTMDLIEDLKAVGYKDDQIQYLELQDGEHNVETWAKAFPDFLAWGWGRTRQ